MCAGMMFEFTIVFRLVLNKDCIGCYTNIYLFLISSYMVGYAPPPPLRTSSANLSILNFEIVEGGVTLSYRQPCICTANWHNIAAQTADKVWLPNQLTKYTVYPRVTTGLTYDQLRLRLKFLFYLTTKSRVTTRASASTYPISRAVHCERSRCGLAWQYLQSC
jgi:hypothetical protein